MRKYQALLFTQDIQENSKAYFISEILSNSRSWILRQHKIFLQKLKIKKNK